MGEERGGGLEEAAQKQRNEVKRGWLIIERSKSVKRHRRKKQWYCMGNISRQLHRLSHCDRLLLRSCKFLNSWRHIILL